jgi:N-acetylneuraminic acid mutarotase
VGARSSSGAAADGGKVLVTGGERDFATPLAFSQIYDPATDQWSTASSMGTPRVLAGATMLPNGKSLVVGGSATSSNNGLNTGEVYDPTGDTWTPVIGTMTDGRGEFPTVVLLPSGKVLIAGGTNASGTATASANLYDPATNSFAPAHAMGTARADAAGVNSTTTRVLAVAR